LPVRLADFSYKPKGKIKDAPDINQVKEYVEHYLLPVLTDTEKKRFAEVEEKWPEYPITLVALASKHPTALPPPSPPRSVAELPKPVRERMDKKIAATKAEKKAYKELKSFEGPNFASKFAEFALRSNLQLGNEYLVSNFTALTLPMKNFINDELMPAMKDRDADQRKLTDSMGKWPEYPKTIQELASKYGLRPPWHILPDDDKFHWDRYRPRKRSADHEKVKDKEES
jgi:hypothetical protein